MITYVATVMFSLNIGVQCMPYGFAGMPDTTLVSAWLIS